MATEYETPLSPSFGSMLAHHESHEFLLEDLRLDTCGSATQGQPDGQPEGQAPLSPTASETSASSCSPTSMAITRSPVRAVAPVDVVVPFARALLDHHTARRTDFAHEPGCGEAWVARCSCFVNYCRNPNTVFSKNDIVNLLGSQMAPGWLPIASLDEGPLLKTFFDVVQAMTEFEVSLQAIPFMLLQTVVLATNFAETPAAHRLARVLVRLPYVDQVLHLPGERLIVRDADLAKMRDIFLESCVANESVLPLLRRSFGEDMDGLLAAIAKSEHAVHILQHDTMTDVAAVAREWMRRVADLVTPLDEVKVPLLCSLVAAGYDVHVNFDFRTTLFRSLLDVAQSEASHGEEAVRAIQKCRKFDIFEKMLSGGKKRSVSDLATVAIDLARKVAGMDDSERRKKR